MSSRTRWVRVGAREMPNSLPPEFGPSAATDLAAELAGLGAPISSTAVDRAEGPTSDDVLDPMRRLDAHGRDLETQMLERWRLEQRRIRVVMAGVDSFEARVLGAGHDVVFVEDEHGRGRLLYRWAIRELVALDEV